MWMLRELVKEKGKKNLQNQLVNLSVISKFSSYFWTKFLVISFILFVLYVAEL